MIAPRHGQFRLTKLEDNLLYYQGLGWGAEEAPVLAEALRHCAASCAFDDGPIRISLVDNEFGEEEEQMLHEAVAGCDGVQALWF